MEYSSGATAKKEVSIDEGLAILAQIVSRKFLMDNKIVHSSGTPNICDKDGCVLSKSSLSNEGMDRPTHFNNAIPELKAIAPTSESR